MCQTCYNVKLERWDVYYEETLNETGFRRDIPNRSVRVYSRRYKDIHACPYWTMETTSEGDEVPGRHLPCAACKLFHKDKHKLNNGTGRAYTKR